ncbi:MAG TPA: hypothetical protein VKG38_09725, partial [Solirubrobacteraceae bacterium]|nr:hypothetical protein [Solirubrobacteraceae bacterium]
MAAIEALLALREMLAIRPHIDLIAPDRDFVYAPMAVAEPFGLAQVGRFDLAAIAEDLGAELHVGCLAGVNRARKHVTLTDGSRLQYDAAIVAVGARRRQWLAGATAFGGAGETSAFADLLARLEGGGVARLG